MTFIKVTHAFITHFNNYGRKKYEVKLYLSIRTVMGRQRLKRWAPCLLEILNADN